MGPEKLDVAVYYIRGLYDLADMAASKHDRATYKWASGEASRLAKARFETTWWYAPAGQYADSLTDTDAPLFQKYWIGQTPMEAEVGRLRAWRRRTTARPALDGSPHGRYSGDRPYNRGLFHTGRGGAPTATATCRSSRSTPPSRRSARATTAAWARTSSSATPTPTPRR